MEYRINENTVLVTNLIPTEESGKETKDGPHFEPEEISIKNNQITVNLKKDPLVIEIR